MSKRHFTKDTNMCTVTAMWLAEMLGEAPMRKARLEDEGSRYSDS